MELSRQFYFPAPLVPGKWLAVAWIEAPRGGLEHLEKRSSFVRDSVL
jgi:hypothetical protein